MLTAHKIKILNSLDQKKYRQKYNLFLVEGNKTISELPGSPYQVREVFATNPEAEELEGLPLIPITQRDLNKISFLKHPKDSVAVVEILPQHIQYDAKRELILDGIQDPGNLGTIIRLADWFGLSQIVCSADTVDYCNPKVIQASMGSFLRTNIAYTDLTTYLEDRDRPLIGTDMEGENVYGFHFPQEFSLVLGNEGNGMRPDTEKMLTHKVTIPRFGKLKSTESLNVSMATAIILGQIFGKA